MSRGFVYVVLEPYEDNGVAHHVADVIRLSDSEVWTECARKFDAPTVALMAVDRVLEGVACCRACADAFRRDFGEYL